jgi:GntR family transcriptional regulator / MocR family aminotransferase
MTGENRIGPNGKLGAQERTRRESLPAAIASIELDRESLVPLYRQLCQALRQAISKGDLWPGLLLPTSYDLASALGVARKTVVAAYSRLAAEGLLASNTRRGTRVAQPAFADRIPVPSDGAARESLHGGAGELLTISYRAQTLLHCSPASAAAEAVQMPDASLYPRVQLGRLLAREFYRPAGPASLAGRQEFQSAISGWLRHTRGVLCDPSQVIPILGLENAVELVSEILVGTGHTAYVENPGDPSVLRALRFGGVQAFPIPVDSEGASLAAAAGPPPRLIVISPALHFPLGYQMSEARRNEALDISNRLGAYLLEVDRGSDLAFWGSKFRSLQSSASADRVVHFGSLHEILGPHIKLGYLVVPLKLAERFASTVLERDLLPESFVMASVGKFVEDGSLAAHIKAVRAIYAQRLELLIRLCRVVLSDIVSVLEPAGGLMLPVRLPCDASEAAMCDTARAAGLSVAPLSQFYVAPSDDQKGLVFGIGQLDIDHIEAAVKRFSDLMTAH